jgi:hypothetical protein
MGDGKENSELMKGHNINGLRVRVRSVVQGLEAEIHLVLDVMLLACRIVDALKAFRAEFPMVSLSLYMEALGAVTQMVGPAQGHDRDLRTA